MRGASCIAAGLLMCCAASLAQSNSNEATLGMLQANGAVHRGRLQALYYYEGMPVNFTCERTQLGRDSQATVQMSYYSKESDAVSTWFQQQDSVDMYFKLTASNNDTILTCTIRKDSQDDIVQMRLLMKTVFYKEGFEVNGLVVARLPESGESGPLRYEYHYIWEERMTVRLVKDENEYGVTRCNVSGNNGFPGPWLDHMNSNETLSLSTGVHLVNTSLQMQQSGTTIECHLRRTAARAGKSKEQVMIITFIYYDLVPFLGGISMANVELLWKTNKTIIYYDNDMSYFGNGTQYLTCNSGENQFVSVWVWYPSQVVNRGDTYPVSFRMNDDVKWSLIECIRKVPDNASIPERILDLWLHRRPEPLTSPLTPPPPPVYHSNSTTPVAERDRTVPIVAGVVASVVALSCVTLALCVVWRRRRTRTRRMRSAASSATNAYVVKDVHQTRPSAASEDEPEYEYIPELPLSASRAPVGIERRAPYPLPPGANEECTATDGRYRHYDTPYEWRIFRFGVRRCACGRCSTSG